MLLRRRELDYMPFNKRFETCDGNSELCHATVYEVCLEGDDPNDSSNWWNEFVDSNGDLHYGRQAENGLSSFSFRLKVRKESTMYNTS